MALAKQGRLSEMWLDALGASGTGRAKTLAEVGQDLQEDLAGFESILGEAFPLAGIDTSTPLVLRPDGKGHILAGKDHPDAATSDELFAGSSPMVGRFMVIAARSALLQAAETSPEFRQAYQADPIAAVEEFEPLLEETMLSFRMSVHNGKPSTGFDEE